VAAAESHRASLSFPSDNGKTGPIAVSSTSRLTCPSSHPLAGDQGCYAEAGFHTRLHWDRLSRGESGLPAAAFLRQGMALLAGSLFRHGVAGDQWSDSSDPLPIDQALLLQLKRATRHPRAAWSFTHFPIGPANQATLPHHAGGVPPRGHAVRGLPRPNKLDDSGCWRVTVWWRSGGTLRCRTGGG
jgi:hypothetical protein